MRPIWLIAAFALRMNGGKAFGKCLRFLQQTLRVSRHHIHTAHLLGEIGDNKRRNALLVDDGFRLQRILQSISLLHHRFIAHIAVHDNLPAHIRAANKLVGALVADKKQLVVFLAVPAFGSGISPFFRRRIIAVSAQLRPQCGKAFGQLGKRKEIRIRLPGKIYPAELDRRILFT